MAAAADPRIVLVDDNPDDRLLAARLLRAELARAQVIEVGGPEPWQAVLEHGSFDLLVTDYALNWSNGLEVLRQVKRRWPDRPVVMLTATGSEEIAVEAMKAGLDDYLLKRAERPLRLVRVVQGLLERAEERRAQHAARAELARQQAERAAIAASLGRLHPRATPNEIAQAVCDEVERTLGLDVARILWFSARPRAQILAGRVPLAVGSDSDLSEQRTAYLRERLLRGPWIEDWRGRSSDEPDVRRWVEAGLQVAAYIPLEGGSSGRGLLVAGSTRPMTTDQTARLLPPLLEYAAVAGAHLRPLLESEQVVVEQRDALRAVIAAGAFRTVFQPIVDMGSRAVVAYEALSRFDDGALPHVRLREARSVGLGIELELALLARTFDSIAPLPAMAALSVNVSPRLVTDDRLAGLLDRSELLTVLEITEHEAIDDYGAIRLAVERLGERVRLAVDDAGAGFASLRHILELRPSLVKLDEQVVRGVDQDPARQAMIAGMVHFAAETDCTLIAEGVETDAQRRILRRLGVAVGQGYLFGRPVPARELIGSAGFPPPRATGSGE